MSKLKSALYLTSASVGAMAAYNALIAAQTPAPSLRLGGYFDRYPARHGDLAYAVLGRADDSPPLLLLHGLRPGASMNDWSEAARELGENHELFALDLPAFGLSAGHKPAPESLVEAVTDFLRDVVKRPAVLVASDSSSALVVRAAQSAPQLVAGVVLVCPPAPLSEPEAHASATVRATFGPHTGRDTSRGIATGNLTGRMARPSLWRRLLEGDLDASRRFWAPRLLSVPVLGRTLLLTALSPSRLKSWARRNGFYDKTRIDARWTRQATHAARAHALNGAGSACVSGELTIPWAEAWRDLSAPALLMWGRHAVADTHGGGLEAAPELLALLPHAQLVVLDRAMLLPHVETPQAFADALRSWLQDALSLSNLER